MTRSVRIALAAFALFTIAAGAVWLRLLAAWGWPWPLTVLTAVVAFVLAVFTAVGVVGFYGMRARVAAEDLTPEPDEVDGDGPEVCINHPHVPPTAGPEWQEFWAELHKNDRERRAS
jgi:hypothetical protein